MLPLHEAVAERLQEAHQRILLLVREAEPSNEPSVHVANRPAGGAFAGVVVATEK